MPLRLQWGVGNLQSIELQIFLLTARRYSGHFHLRSRRNAGQHHASSASNTEASLLRSTRFRLLDSGSAKQFWLDAAWRQLATREELKQAEFG